jgi:hypothetical protein
LDEIIRITHRNQLDHGSLIEDEDANDEFGKYLNGYPISSLKYSKHPLQRCTFC